MEQREGLQQNMPWPSVKERNTVVHNMGTDHKDHGIQGRITDKTGRPAGLGPAPSRLERDGSAQ